MGDRISGPNSMADFMEDQITDITSRLESGELTRAERKPLNKRLHYCRQMLAWCKTRAGYVPPVDTKA